MKNLQIYKKLNLNNEKEVFDYFLSTLTDSIFTWDYFVGFSKVKENISKIEKELNLLNILIGKENVEDEFLNLIEEYPKVRKILPILIAIRQNKLKDTKIIDDFEELISESKTYLFDPSEKLSDEIKDGLLKFFNESGLKDIFQDKNIKNVVDYSYGVEVGMDTNARKNRTGTSMEKIVEKILDKFSKENGFEYICQATQKKIKQKWELDVDFSETNRIPDFAIYDKTKNKLFLFETNYYSGTGSKVKSTAGEYKSLFDLFNKQNITFIWVTDGLGWNKTKNALSETFNHLDYVFNIELLKQDVLKEILF